MTNKKECVDFLIKTIKNTYQKQNYLQTGRTDLKVIDKNVFDEVTNLDLEVEKELISKIKKEYPNSHFLSEEFNFNEQLKDNTWIIDPIDGTWNLTHNINLFGVQCALYDKGEIQLSVIFIPASGEFFTAINGKGAFLNGRKIHCSNRSTKHSIISFGDSRYNSEETKRTKYTLMEKFSKKVGKVRMYGASCIDFTYCACGRLDGNISFVKNPWDIAPGLLLCKEAGMEICTIEGEPYLLGKSETIAVFNSKQMKEELLN